MSILPVMATPTLELELTTEETALPIRNLYPLYLHDIASYEHKPPNRHGVLVDNDDTKSWEELLDSQRTWWRTPELLFPYVIRVDGTPVGFSFVASGPYVPTDGVDLVIYEFFVVHAARGSGAAAWAAKETLARHRGSWEIATWTTASRAIAFWRRSLGELTDGRVVETNEEHEWGPRVVWRFENSDAT